MQNFTLFHLQPGFRKFALSTTESSLTSHSIQSPFSWQRFKCEIALDASQCISVYGILNEMYVTQGVHFKKYSVNSFFFYHSQMISAFLQHSSHVRNIRLMSTHSSKYWEQHCDVTLLSSWGQTKKSINISCRLSIMLRLCINATLALWCTS